MNNNPIEERKLRFYERVRKATGLSNNEIRQFLSERYDKYDPNMEKEYLNGLYMWGKLQYHMEKAKKISNIPLCSVCNSATVPDKDWGWTCATGGLRHRIVSTVSKISGVSTKTLLEKLEEFNDKERLRSATRAAEERSEIRYRSER